MIKIGLLSLVSGFLSPLVYDPLCNLITVFHFFLIIGIPRMSQPKIVIPHNAYKCIEVSIVKQLTLKTLDEILAIGADCAEIGVKPSELICHLLSETFYLVS